MIFALLTSICWSFSGFGSSRVAREWGAASGNGLRLLLSTLVLLGICLVKEVPLLLPGAHWFALAGFCHLCLADIGLFAVYRRLGPRIGVLMVSSLAPATALLGEWLLLGTTLSPGQLIVIAMILTLVILAVAPRERNHLSFKELKIGIFAGIFAALLQGSSAVVNRYAYTQLPEDLSVSPWSASLLRVAAGAAGVAIWILYLQLWGKKPLHRPQELLPHKKIQGHPVIWMLISVSLGPVLGVMFLMRAFETTPSGLVQAIISTLPVFMIPLAWLLDGNRPSLRSVICGCGAVGLTFQLMVL